MSPDPILDDLTDQQRRAVAHKDGPLLVLAGAGTGKTRVITRRIAALVRSGVPAERILAITFTNKAAGEMRERTRQLVGDDPTVTTFHSFGARIVRRHCDELGLSRRFTIFDETDQKACVKDAAEEAQIDLESWPPRALLSSISALKNRLLSDEEVQEEAVGPRARAVAAVFPIYQQLLRGRDACDFDDLIALPVLLFRAHPELADRWSRWYRYILIDEYQDTNKVQYELAMALAREHANLCVTGDPDQAIYGWRGADIRNILDFESEFPKAAVVPLTNNFRSTQHILDAANKVIAHNIHRKEKELVGVKGAGEPIELRGFDSGGEESFFVARSIADARREGTALLDMAVLYRANSQSRLIEESLIHRGIPYHVVGAVAFYQRKEIRDLLAYLRVLANPNDDYGALRIINIPPRRIGAATLKKLQAHRRIHELSLFESAAGADAVRGLGSAAKKALKGFVALMTEVLDGGIHEAGPALRKLIEVVGYRGYLEKAYPEEGDRLENVAALVEAAEEFDRSARSRPPPRPMDGLELPPATGVQGFLEHVALLSAADDLDELRDRVALMTVHTAKGLEFDTVFMIGMEDGIFPNSRALDNEGGMEEERRLAYVAMTRAKRRLVMSHAQTRTRFGSFNILEPSPFLYEAELLDESRRPRRPRRDEDSQLPPGDWDDPPQDFAGDGASEAAAPRTRWAARQGRRQDRRQWNRDIAGWRSLSGGRGPRGSAPLPRREPEGSDFAAGDRVRHEHFGLGDVSSVSGAGPSARVRVTFDRYGEKTLVLLYARLTKVQP